MGARAGAALVRAGLWLDALVASNLNTATALTSSPAWAFRALAAAAIPSTRAAFLLGGLVHLGDGFSHLADSCALFAAGGADLSHDVGHAADGADDFGHGGSGFVHQGGATLHALHAGANQALDLLGGLGAALRQAAHLARNHRKAPALFACAGRFDGCVERQDVGLEGDAVDDADGMRDICTSAMAPSKAVSNPTARKPAASLTPMRRSENS